MPNKTYLELATDVVPAMISRGYLKVPPPTKDVSWKESNRTSVHTVGWAILEMYREIQSVPKRADEEARKPKEEPRKPRIIVAK